MKICNRCILDETARDIEFDDYGNCNFCNTFLSKNSEYLKATENEKSVKLEKLIKEIRSASKTKKYDCVVGLSGGVDSSWAICKAIEVGLKPLAVHMDNGWNSELAQNNISNLIRTLKVDLYTHVINWEEYKNLQEAFFKANVIDIEILYDNAANGVLFKVARKFGIKYILAGTNIATEGISIPEDWKWYKLDARNIKGIARKFKANRIRSFPLIGTIEGIYSQYLKGIQFVSFLDFFLYEKEKAISYLVENYQYKPYEYKHYESVFTRFYQGYLLPKKFNIDKRKVHLSTLIMSNQLTREQALRKLKDEPYGDNFLLKMDIKYFLKKMNWTKKDLEIYLSRPRTEHSVYPSEFNMYNLLSKIYKFLFIKSRPIN